MAEEEGTQHFQATEMISLSERESLLRATPGFSQLSVAEISQLVGLMNEVSLNPGDVAVTEGDLIDSIYLIASGSLEVTKQISLDGKEGVTFLATLNQGESIGLKEARLFTETGRRSATVKAITPCVLLKLELKTFNQFFSEHSNILQSLKNSTDMMLRMQFIKDSDPFMKLSNQRIAWLANSVKEIKVAAQKIIFKQEDVPDNCYMIVEGSVEINTKQADGTEKIITLKEGQLFGERAVLKAKRRNFTAKALTDCRLLVLDQEVLQELTSEPGENVDELISGNMSYNQPIRTENIIYQQRTMADGQTITTLKNPVNNTYLQLTEDGWFIWQQMNGQLSVQEITNLYLNRFQQSDAKTVLQIILTIVDAGFARLDILQTNLSSLGRVSTEKKGLQNVLRYVYFFKNPQKKMDALYRLGGHLIFSIPVLIFFILIMLTGIVLFPSVLASTLKSITSIHHIIILLILVISISMFLRLFNPIAKALTIKRFGHEVPSMALIWYVLGPLIYVDMSDLWISKRLPRIATILAGMGADFLMASLLTCYSFFYPDSSIALFTSLCAIYIYLAILRSLDPLQDLEGYQLITNLLDSPKLREISIKWFFQKIPGLNTKPIILKLKQPIYLYYLYCLLFILFNLLMVAWIIHLLPADFLFHTWQRAMIYLFIMAGFFLEWILEINYQIKVTRILASE